MANELEITGILKFSKGGVKQELSLNHRIDIAGSKVVELVQSIPAGSTTPINFGDIAVTDLGYAIIENLDDTNFVTVRSIEASDNSAYIRILPNSFAGPFMFNKAIFNTGANQTKPYAVADTAACNIRVIAIQT
tara:strand:- start:96 stop:497 length:402 start_codon:yes stop_codon:yes gene_type:complete